jgi:hypothetical protein
LLTADPASTHTAGGRSYLRHVPRGAGSTTACRSFGTSTGVVIARERLRVRTTYRALPSPPAGIASARLCRWQAGGHRPTDLPTDRSIVQSPCRPVSFLFLCVRLFCCCRCGVCFSFSSSSSSSSVAIRNRKRMRTDRSLRFSLSAARSLAHCCFLIEPTYYLEERLGRRVLLLRTPDRQWPRGATTT